MLKSFLSYRAQLGRVILLCVINLLITLSVFADYTIPQGVTVDASTLKSQTGVLTIYGKLTVSSNVTLSGITNVIVKGPSGQIYWNNNSDLTFNSGTGIVIESTSQGLQPTAGNGNASQRLIVGSAIIAVSSDKSSVSTFSFEQFNLQGGLPDYTITSNSPVCSNTVVNLSIAPEKTVTGVVYSYKWYYNSIQVSTNSSATLPLLAPGNYTITCLATANTFQTTKTIQVTVKATYTWLGVSSDWNDPANWCPAVPTAGSDVTIPASVDYPVISASAVAYVRNLTISAGGTLKVTGTLKIAGSLTNQGTLDITEGTLSMNGTSAQTLAGSMFYNKTINNLILSNSSSAGVTIASTLNDTLKISGLLSFGYSNAKLNTGNNLNLLSTSSGTASLGELGPGNSITGSVIVDRYIALGTGPDQHEKSWQFLATPTNGQSIKQSWMEDQRNNGGYGTTITGPAGTSAGFDAYSPGISIKYYNDQSNAWEGVPNTNSGVYNPKGYMLFVRGDRTVGSYFSPPKPTILRSKGTLNSGTQSPISVVPDHYQSVGNPYAAPVDFSLLTRSGGVDNKFYSWDPYLYGSYGVGGYQTISGSNNWKPVPGGTTAYPSGVSHSIIQSGQAIFVHATSSSSFKPQEPSITFTESSKATGGSMVNFARKAARLENSQRQFLRVSLFTGTGPTAVIADGNAVAFDAAFSDSIDGDDALKLINGGENFGIKRAGKILAVEAKAPVTIGDTIFYTMSHLRQQTYQLRFAPENMQSDQLQAFLLDQYLNTSTEISLVDSSRVTVSITADKASSASDRFTLVFRSMAVLPVTLTSVKAVKKNATVLVEWEAENESRMQSYQVQRSLDGNDFVSIGEVNALNQIRNRYQFTDNQPANGNNYYRIRSMTAEGKPGYSAIVKVTFGASALISVYPNPIQKGVINLQFQNQPQGLYQCRLVNSAGEVVLFKQLHLAGNTSESLHCESLPKGIYQLVIKKPDGSTATEPIILL